MQRLAATIITLGLVTLGLPSRVHAQELRNDGYTPGGAATFTAGFVSGEIAAARFTPAGPSQLTTVRLLFGGTALGGVTVRLHVWADTGSTIPGGELFAGDYFVASSSDAFSELDLSTPPLLVSGTFRVGIEFTGDGLPSVGLDTDGTLEPNNFVRLTTIGWVASSTISATGDWIIRALVIPELDAGVTLDASVTDASVLDAASVDANLADASPLDAPAEPDASSGGCRSNTECALGQYCGPAGVCSFDCRADGDCESGASCNSLGRCVAPAASSGCGCRAASGGPPHGALAFFAIAMLLRARRRR